MTLRAAEPFSLIQTFGWVTGQISAANIAEIECRQALVCEMVTIGLRGPFSKW
jgi:hypothetical protein